MHLNENKSVVFDGDLCEDCVCGDNCIFVKMFSNFAYEYPEEYSIVMTECKGYECKYPRRTLTF